MLVVVALFAPLLSVAQYSNNLYDIDSTGDIGTDLGAREDGNFLVFGVSIKSIWPSMGGIVINQTGNLLLKGRINTNPTEGYFHGSYGNLRPLKGDRFLSAITIRTTSSSINEVTSNAAFVWLDKNGDSLRVRTYSDTAIEKEIIRGFCITKNGDIVAGGTNAAPNADSFYQALLFRTDSNGNLLWKKTFRKSPSKYCVIRTVEELPDGRLIVCATSANFVTRGQRNYYQTPPWIFITDSAGNILNKRYCQPSMGQKPCLHYA